MAGVITSAFPHPVLLVEAGRMLMFPPIRRGRCAVYERQVELSVGQVLQVGDVLLTILDIDGDEIHVQIDTDRDLEEIDSEQRTAVLALPR
jgi:hypothetical protein